MKLKKIRLKSKEERRFKQGHPWVFSNELQESPKGVELGELLELHDASGNFMAYGFGNPNSLISFRELSRAKEEGEVEPDALVSKILSEKMAAAHAFRKSWFSSDQSYRFLFGEADGLSGLIIDRFSGKDKVVYVVQPHTAGMDLRLPLILKALSQISTELKDPKATYAIVRRDAGSREREGLEQIEPKVHLLSTQAEATEATAGFEKFEFFVSGVMGSTVSLKTNLISGQKTGFFFDQFQNIRLLETLLLRKLRLDGIPARVEKNPYRVLDLCSYVGQWSVHLTQTLMERECLPIELTCVDASESALTLAQENIDAFTQKHKIEAKVKVTALKHDVLKPMDELKEKGFDLVIADPPAFIKNRKSIPQGKAAYVNLFQTAISKTRVGGLVVFCSCSQLLSQEEFFEVLGKAARRSGRKVRFLLQGSPSFDHFTRLDFQEGYYLKSFIAQVDETK